MAELLTNLENRERLISSIEEEIVGPTKNFDYAMELNEKTSDSDSNQKFYYWKYGEKKEEIMNQFESPSRKYAAGLLYPSANTELVVETEEELALNQISETDDNMGRYKLDTINTENDTDEESPNQEYTFGESSFGITFAVPENIEILKLSFACGAYSKKIINKEIQDSKKWLFRKSLNSVYYLDFTKGNPQVNNHILELTDNENKVYNGLQMRLDVVTRKELLKIREESVYLVTVTITNVTKGKRNDDRNISFQNKLVIESGNIPFVPYPSASELEANISDEDKMFDMLYSSEKNYSFGKNCSAIWDTKQNQVYEISSTFLPEYETYTMSPDITINGEPLEISHAALAAAENYEELESIFVPLFKGYEQWIRSIKEEPVNSYYEEVKKANIDKIETTYNRAKKGLEILSENKNAFNVFKMANLAMLMQMVNGKNIRPIRENADGYYFTEKFDNIFSDLDYSDFESISQSISEKIESESDESPYRKYKWRGFQIAFFLLSIESIVNKNSFDREVVDLIWFPTGGGKTEAYLAVSAFSMLYRRISNPEDTGVEVIMRYTLRLLTADQFQRSARLICSLEYLRSHMEHIFGKTEFSIGLWVGGTTTPNQIDDAKRDLNRILSGKSNQGFTITNCSWCGAEIKQLESNNAYPGYKIKNGDFHTHCPDKNCHFHQKLPLYFIDEQIYEKRPSFLIGTVDKFVQLTWRPQVRYLFGLDDEGRRILSPPNLIIQDELHLISGPLGTLNGIYETLIEELCTDYRDDEEVVPKVISATATIKAYKEQIQALFGRENSMLFPPTGLDINDNFFSTIKKDSKGEPVPGKKYVGVFTTTQGLLQTQVQAITRLITEVNEFDEDERDPFWTILSFYNSLREIGTTLSLTNQDIPHEITNYYNKRGIKKRRYLENTLELTSRISNDEVVKIIEKLKTEYSSKDNQAIDLTLASNIIEVGIDVDRLALMLVNGQPRSTSQYIQVTGRIGRKPDERPGLVFTLYNPQKSIDKSHYEHFIEYHQKLYGQVEESSVTPFSHFAIERGLPAVIVGYLRQFFDIETLGMKPDSEQIKSNMESISRFIRKIISRAKSMSRAEEVDSSEIEFISSKAKEVLSTLMYNSYEQWVHTNRKKGAIINIGSQEDVSEEVIPMINTMRSVDANSRLAIKESINVLMDDEDWGF